MANPFGKIRIFFGETVAELKKASWPTRMELRDSTVVVLIAVVLLGAAIFVADWSVFNWVTFLTKLIRPELDTVG